MSYSKLNGGACVLFVALAMLIASSQLAMADTKTLVCQWTPELQFTIDLNEVQGIVTINYPASTASGSTYVSPAHTVGPMAATFDSKAVTFDSKDPSFFEHYTIDRVTGLFSMYSSANAPWDQAAPQDRFIRQYNCHVSNAQF
jgi:hypothetical protein